MSFHVAHEFYVGGNRDVQDAIIVSFLEELDFGNNKWAWELLTRELKEELQLLIESGMAPAFQFDRSG